MAEYSVPDNVHTSSPIDVNMLNEFYMNSFFQENTMTDYAVLKIAVDDRLHELYHAHVETHNATISHNLFPNAGFDLFVPQTETFDAPFAVRFVNLGVKCEMIYCNKSVAKMIDAQKEATASDTEVEAAVGISYHTGYYMFPRSSIAKTPLMLANHTGIIDSGYRGHLIAAVRSLSPAPYVVAENTRLFQICHPSLCPVFVVMVPEAELTSTARGAGGFGSTG